MLTMVGAGCSEGDDQPQGTHASPSTAATAAPELVREAGRICSDARDQFASLVNDGIDVDPNSTDPLREGLIRPGTKIYARQAERLRDLTARVTPTEAVNIYTGYFELIDALLNARLLVGEPGGPDKAAAQPLEARFEAIAAEQDRAATAAGLPNCAIDVTTTIFGK